MVGPSFGTKGPTLLLSGPLWVKLHFILVFIPFTVQMDKTDSSDYDSNDSHDSVTSSIFGFTCKICHLRAIKQTHLEDQFLQDVVFMSDLDNEIWVKCDNCESAFHKSCWESYNDNVPVCFVCCKYCIHCVFIVLQPHLIVFFVVCLAWRKVLTTKSHWGLGFASRNKVQIVTTRGNAYNCGPSTYSPIHPSYSGPRFRCKTVTKLIGLLPETFCCRTTGPLKGFYSHLSGGKGIPRIFTPDEETMLVGHIEKFAQARFPFTLIKIRSIAFEFAELNSIQVFNPKSLGKLAGSKWLKEFLSRHDNLSISTPKLLSIYRAHCANPTVITKWFELYEEVLHKNGIKSPLRI